MTRELTLTEAEYVEIRAQQRTFEGAYWRTTMTTLLFSTIILRVFEKSFYKIGMLLVVFGLSVMYISLLRRRNILDVLDKSKPFITSGSYVALISTVALTIYSLIYYQLYFYN